MFEVCELIGYGSSSVRLGEKFQVSFLALRQQKSTDQLCLVHLARG